MEPDGQLTATKRKNASFCGVLPSRVCGVLIWINPLKKDFVEDCKKNPVVLIFEVNKFLRKVFKGALSEMF